MKLISCYISSFGKIKNFNFDFNDKINTIKEDNGWGKSTFATFIKCMFYGLSRKSKGLENNDRLQFKPWNSTEKFGGYIIFEKGGKQYKLQRYFGNKESEDTAVLFDLSTNKEFDGTDIGKRVFSIDQDGFLSTTFFSQKDFEIKSNSSLTSKFNEIYEMQDENTFEKSIELLTAKSKEYVKTGNKGKIAETKDEIRQLEEEVNRLNQEVNSLRYLKETNDKLLIEKTDLSKQKEQLEIKKDRLLQEQGNQYKRNRFDLLKKEKEKYLEQQKNCQIILNNNLDKGREINVIEQKASEYNAYKSKRTLLEEMLPMLENNQPKKGGVSPLIFLLLTILLCVSVGLIFVNAIVALIAFIVTVCAFVGILFLYIKGKNAGAKKQAISEISLKKAESSKLNEEIIKLDYYFNNYFAPFNIDSNLSLSEKIAVLKDTLIKLESSNKEIENCQKELDELSQDKGIFNLQESGENLDEITAKIDKLKNAINEKTEEYSSNKVKISRLENGLEKLFEDESAINEKKEDLIKYQKDYNIILKTIELFNIANDNLKTKYKSPLENSLNKYLKCIDNKEIKAKIDIDFNITIEENQGEMDTGYYSKGYQNLFEICKRFALIDVLFKGDKPFVILDDPFYNLDDEKIKKAIELINKLKDEYQIIYFVCHESRRA